MSSVVTAIILSNNSKMNPEYNIMSIDIIKEVNKIPTAQIILLDGDSPREEFAISNTDFFKPGNNIEIKLRYEGETQAEATVFQGIVVRHSVQADQYSSLLRIDLKDEAIKLTTQRKSAVFRDKTDKEIIEAIINPPGKTIDETQPKHKEMVQFYCTDWDFIVSRADASGHWVLAENGKISVEKPNLNGTPKHVFEYCISEIYQFEMAVDILDQYGAVNSVAWDVNEKQLSQPKTAEELSLTQGNLEAAELAKAIGSDKYQLVNSGQLDAAEIKAWADAKMLKSRMSMLRGHLTVAGLANINLGDIINISGISNRFNGKTLVTGIRHQVNENNWQTDIQFGLSANWFSQENNDVIDTPAAGLLPAINGLQIGIVDEYQDDPDNQFRVKVKIPSIEKDGIVWARLASIDAGGGRGIFFRPEKGDEVVLGFLNDDPRQAIILGAMHSPKNPLPKALNLSSENYKKGIVTKELLQIIFDDENKLIELRTPNGNILNISDKQIYLKYKDENDENGNSMIINNDGLHIKSKNNIVIEGGNITIKGSKVDVVDVK